MIGSIACRPVPQSVGCGSRSAALQISIWNTLSSRFAHHGSIEGSLEPCASVDGLPGVALFLGDFIEPFYGEVVLDVGHACLRLCANYLMSLHR